MENIISDLFFKINSQYGLLAAALVIAIIIFFLLNTKAAIRYVVHNVFPFTKTNPKKLQKHSCFIQIDHILNYKLYRLNVQCPIREKLFFDIMQMHIKSIKDKINDFIQTDIVSLTPQELAYRIDELVMQSINESNMKLIQKGTPKFILKAMDDKISPILKMHHQQIKLYCYNHYLYKGNVSKMWAIMDLVPIAVEYYMNLLETSLSEFNGDIKKLNYNGVKCRKCAHCVHDDFITEQQQHS